MPTFDDTKTILPPAPLSINAESVFSQDTAIKSVNFPPPPSEALNENRAGHLTAWEDTKFRIEKYKNYQMEWDGEDADPISEGTATFALSLMQCAYEAAKENNVGWRSPDVAPDPDGQLDLLWMVSEKSPRELWLNLLISEAKRDAIVAIKKTTSNVPERFVLSQQQAIDAILWILAVQP